MSTLDLDYLFYIQDEKRLPEERLWIGVLLTACRDAQGINCYHEIEVEAARRWLLSATNKDRETVCDLAGIPEHSILSWAHQTLQFVERDFAGHDSSMGCIGAARVA